MKEILDRLKLEKDQALKDYVEIGKRDGREWAQSASYKELAYVFNWEPLFDQYTADNLELTDLVRDPVLGHYFKLKLDSDPYLKPRNPVERFNYFVLSWFKGWIEGAEDFWYDVERILES